MTKKIFLKTEKIAVKLLQESIILVYNKLFDICEIYC